MLGGSARNALAPEPKTARFQISAHDFYNLWFGKAAFFFDFIKRNIIRPCHADNVVDECLGMALLHAFIFGRTLDSPPSTAKIWPVIQLF